uniref:Reverse transcriptase Ty1/copia-type domain-containing protein n=1 Tax=Tanacetum cinerariifolium TaxID=118510 RepID=A0A699I7D4_TANCI|nr:hypothetical protein [Tanacetum cinerariifolium]
MKYQLVTASNPSKPGAGFQEQFDAEKAEEENVQQYVLFPLCSAKTKKNDDKNKRETKGKSPVELARVWVAAGPSNTAISPTHGKSSYVDTSQYPDDPNIPALEEITYSDDEEDVGAEADFSNMETTITFSLIPTTRVQKDHPVTQIIGNLSLANQKRSMTRVVKDQSGLTQINNEDFQTCMFACFLSQEEPRRVHQALKDLSWIEVMQDELLQFKMQKVWVLVDFLNGKRAIGHTQEKGIDYEEVFAPVAMIEVIRLIYWQCKKQTVVATLSTKAEYAAAKFLIHTILQCMSAKRTSWNEFSSSMASAVICLSIGAAGVGVNVDNEGADAANVKPSIPSPTPTTQPPPPSQELPST